MSDRVKSTDRTLVCTIMLCVTMLVAAFIIEDDCCCCCGSYSVSKEKEVFETEPKKNQFSFAEPAPEKNYPEVNVFTFEEGAPISEPLEPVEKPDAEPFMTWEKFEQSEPYVPFVADKKSDFIPLTGSTNQTNWNHKPFPEKRLPNFDVEPLSASPN